MKWERWLKDTTNFEPFHRRKGPSGHDLRQSRPECMHKHSYNTVTAADAMCKRRMGQGVPYLRSYKCPLYPHWHITSQPL
jgi:hypothetical protein